MCPLPSFNSYKFLAIFVAESILLPTFPLSIVFLFFFPTHPPQVDTSSNSKKKKKIIYKSRDAVKLPGWNFWEFICRCWPRATGREPQSPWRVRPPRRWGALCRCSECPWCSDLINEEPGRGEHAHGQQHHCQMAEDSRVHWAGWCTCSWPWALFCQALGNPPLSPEEHVICSVSKQI